MGFGTRRGSTTWTSLGTFHFSAGIGLRNNSLRSTAYSTAAFRIFRRRLTTLVLD
jgi:hypothetical protein